MVWIGQRRRSFLFLFITMIAIAACTSLRRSPRPFSPVAGGPVVGERFSIFYSPSPQGELEPCGCAIRPLGGVEREANLIRSLKRKSPHASSVLLSSGPIFVPRIATGPQGPEYYAQKGKFLVEALNLQGAKVIAPSIVDLQLSLDSLQTLKSESKFAWVSSNVRSKDHPNLFEPFHEIKLGRVSVAVLGLTGSHGTLPPGVRVIEPEKAVESVLNMLPKEPRLVIVLTDLETAERERILDLFPEINLMLGGTANDTSSDVALFSKNQLASNPPGRGHSLAYFDFKFLNGWFPFYNDNMAIVLSSRREAAQNRISVIRSELETEHFTSDEKKRLEAEVTEKETFLKRSQNIPLHKTEGQGSELEATVYDLDSAWDKGATPQNELGALIKRYKKTIRDSAANATDE